MLKAEVHGACLQATSRRVGECASWNIRDKNYCNKSLRDTVFKQLMSELEENQLLGQMDKKQLKAKIKSIKDVYRKEEEK